MASDKKPLPARPAVVEQSASQSRRAKPVTGESTSSEIIVAHDLLNILESAKSRPTGGKTSQTRTTGLIHISSKAAAEEGGENSSWMKMAMVIAVAAIGVGGISSWLKKNASQPATAPVTATAEPAPANKINTINSVTPASPSNVAAVAPAVTAPAPPPVAAVRSAAAAALAATAAAKTAQALQEAEHERERQKELELQAQKDREADEERENALREPASRAEETNGAAAPAPGAPGSAAAQPAGAPGANEEMTQQQPPAAAAPPESASQ